MIGASNGEGDGPAEQVSDVELLSGVLSELITIWDQHAPVPTALVVPSVDPTVVLPVRALTAHAVECGRGVLALFRAGHPVVSVPVIRTMMEDAVVAAWLVKKPGAWKGILREGAYDRRALMGDVIALKKEALGERAEAEWQSMNALFDEYEEFRSERKFEHRARSVTGSREVYMQYRMASNLSHAGLGIVHLYSAKKPAPYDGIGWVDKPGLSGAEGWVQVAASSLLRAMRAWDQLLLEHPLSGDLSRIAELLGSSEVLSSGGADAPSDESSP